MSDARARTDQVVGKFIVWKLKSGAVDASARTQRRAGTVTKNVSDIAAVRAALTTVCDVVH